jgi:hypothetical protein
MGESAEFEERFNAGQYDGFDTITHYECKKCGACYEVEGWARKHIISKHKQGIMFEHHAQDGPDYYYRIPVKS